MRRVLLIACVVLAANFAVVALSDGYDTHLGWLHLVAHGCFKPLLLMNGAFLLASLAGNDSRRALFDEAVLNPPNTNRWLFWILVTALALTVHWQSLTVDFLHPDWNHEDISAAIRRFSDVWRLFSQPQTDGFYRPMTFLSLWGDYSIFRNAPLAYHIQSLLLHIGNCILVGVLGRRLDYGPRISNWAALLYSCCPPSFEPVLWPAVRFDLLVTLFSLACIILSLEYLRRGGWTLAGAALSLVAALLNKETGYAVPVIMAGLVFSGTLWGLDKEASWRSQRSIRLFAALTSICVAMIAVRFLIFGDLGGYPAVNGHSSPSFTIGVRSFEILFTRLIPLSVMAVNTTYLDSSGVRAALLLLPVTLAGTCMAARAGRRERMLLCIVVLSGLPVLTLIGWIGPSAQQSRYLYLPACWMCIFVPAVLSGAPYRKLLCFAWLASYTVILLIDQHVYRHVLERIPATIALVRHDLQTAPAITTIELRDIPPEPFGVFFFRSELADRMTMAFPQVRVAVTNTSVAPQTNKSALRYAWSPRYSGELIARQP